MKSQTNNLFESFNINLNEETDFNQQLKQLGILEIGASSEHKRADEDELNKLQGSEFTKWLNDNPKNAELYGYIYIKHKDLGDIFVSYNTETNKIDTTGFPWHFIEKDTTSEQREFIENNKEFLDNYIQSGEINNYVNLEESTKAIEEKSIYDYTKEDIEKMNLDEMIKLYSKICIETDMDTTNLLRFLNNSNCLNTGSFRNMLEETIEYMHFGDND